MVNVALAIALSSSPVADARALTVVVAVTLNGPAYKGELLVGTDPSVVYRITASGVTVAIVTCTGCVKLPPAGLIVGVAALFATELPSRADSGSNHASAILL
jgi:hypothetical protein